MKRSIIVCMLLVIIMFSFDPCMSQSDIYLQHRSKPNRKKMINLNHTYTVRTIDSSYYHVKLSIYNKDTLILNCEGFNNSTDIAIDEVIFLEKVKKSYVLKAVATIGIIGLTISPIIWATEGNEAALGMLQVSGVFLAASVPFLIIKEIGRKKNTKNKWLISIT